MVQADSRFLDFAVAPAALGMTKSVGITALRRDLKPHPFKARFEDQINSRGGLRSRPW
jgi:hypothetical protein